MADYLVFCLSSAVLLLLFSTTIQNVDVLAAQVMNDGAEQHPATDFSRHTLIKPRIYHGREKRQISNTKEDKANRINNGHIDHITIELPLDGGKDLILDLTLNKQLITKGFFRRTQHEGSHKIHRPRHDEIDFCHYWGHVRDTPGSWAALSTCNGELSGVVFDGDEMHYVEKSHANDDDHYLFRHSDLRRNNKTCGFHDPDYDSFNYDEKHNRMLRYKRSADGGGNKQHEMVRGPFNANKESKYVELVLVVDNREYKEQGESISRVEQNCQSLANIINGLYAPLNIFIALVGVVIWTEHDEISFSSNGDTTLTNFLHYRREKLVKEHPNDNAQLLTRHTFDNGVVGKALKGPICTYEYSGGVNTNHSSVIGLVATTVAHEMGHNFGMEHDTNDCKCPDDRCIMAPSSSTVAPTHWSSCSLNYLLLAFAHGMDYCLKNKPESLFNSPVCGNGFVEPGEQCDCGLPEHCDNSCCNASTCMLYANASCATGECCDLSTCHPKNAGTLCRSADYECDLPEYCTGQSEYCPDDIYKMDTEVCDNGNAFCYHGYCRTRTDQCRLLWGETGKASDEQCYKMNIKGTRHGNCGYNKFNQSFSKCNNDDVLCGMLHCKHFNERLEFGMESVAILSHSFINSNGSIIACRTAIVDLGINQIDPGLAPDGAKCGEGKMCVNQKCMSVGNLQMSTKACPENCNNNGWCNNLGHCHCRKGFAPPYCSDPGPGGSEDSGPASDPNANREFVVALFVVFLGIIPLLAIFAFIYYYLRQNVLKTRLTKALSNTSKSPSKSRGPPFSHQNLTNKRQEDNHTLLLQEDTTANGLQNQFFGQFKGFTLAPAKENEQANEPSPAEPVRPAPLPPPAVKSPSVARPAPAAPKREQSFKQSLSGAFSFINSSSTAPALPPPNPGSTAKLIISSPILENSTCTAKELISPLRNAPKLPVRPAPDAPAVVEDKKSSGLNRIASFLKNDKKQQVATLPRSNQVKAQKILDKNALRSIEISGPIIVQSTISGDEADNGGKKSVVTRAQSMRGPKVTPRPNIQSFGSMRQTSTGPKRPLSIPSGVRPKSPPPPAPPAVEKTLPVYQKPIVAASSEYDDCLNNAAPLARISDDLSTPSSSDNIYAVIEESPVVSPESKSSNDSSLGLLGEIVSEIQNRNFDSIYSTSTLARKKKQQEEEESKKGEDDSTTYVNTSQIYKTPSSPESVYSNMNSNNVPSASSSSSGYILPSAVNVPVKTPSKPTYKNEPKAFSSTFSRPPGPLASSYAKNTKSSPKSNVGISRQTTPPNLRTRKASPTRNNKARPVSNSPDLVTSCSNNTKAKTPDVVNNSKKPVITAVKPTNVTAKPKSVSFNKAMDKKVPSSISNKEQGSVGVRNAARSNSNVASLQQKFEGKT